VSEEERWVLVVHEPRVEAALRLLAPWRGRVYSMLDIGCGDGSVTALVAEAVGAERVYGVDIDAERLGEAGRRGVRVFNVDASRDPIPLPGSSLDLVTSFEVIEHLLDPDHMLDEAWRLLRTGGLLLVTTPNLGSWVNRLILAAGYQPYTAEVSARRMYGVPFKGGSYGSRPSGHIRPFTLRALREIVEAHGFRIERVAGAPGVEPRNKLFNLIDSMFARLPGLARRLVVLAVKDS